MVSVTEYAFSWYTIGAIVVYFALAVAAYRYIRDHHPELHERFGGHRIWFSAPDQLRFFGFLFGFHYFEEHDTTLSSSLGLCRSRAWSRYTLSLRIRSATRGTVKPSNQNRAPSLCLAFTVMRTPLLARAVADLESG
jgi:hypothetical protein